MNPVRKMVLISVSSSLVTFVCLGEPTNEWRQVLEQVSVPKLDLKDATLSDAIRPINQAIVDSVTNGTPPVVTVDLSPTKVTFTNCTASSTFDRYIDELIVRWKQKNADVIQPEVPHPLTFTAQYISALKAIKIITSCCGGPRLRDREGKPFVGYEPNMLIECRTYLWPEGLGQALYIKEGIAGAEDLECYFWSTGVTFPKRYTMMLVPGTNVVLLVGAESSQKFIGQRLIEMCIQEKSGSAVSGLETRK